MDQKKNTSETKAKGEAAIRFHIAEIGFKQMKMGVLAELVSAINDFATGLLEPHGRSSLYVESIGEGSYDLNVADSSTDAVNQSASLLVGLLEQLQHSKRQAQTKVKFNKRAADGLIRFVKICDANKFTIAVIDLSNKGREVFHVTNETVVPAINQVEEHLVYVKTSTHVIGRIVKIGAPLSKSPWIRVMRDDGIAVRCEVNDDQLSQAGKYIKAQVKVYGTAHVNDRTRKVEKFVVDEINPFKQGGLTKLFEILHDGTDNHYGKLKNIADALESLGD